MQLDMVEKKENKALHRQEALFKMADAKVTPSRKELRPKIAALLNTKENLVVIAKVSHAFGAREALVDARAYENEGALKKYELKHLVTRGRKKEEAKPAQKKEEKGEKEEKPAGKEEEKPAEGKKEEKAGRKEEKPAEKKEEGKKPEHKKEEEK